MQKSSSRLSLTFHLNATNINYLQFGLEPANQLQFEFNGISMPRLLYFYTITLISLCLCGVQGDTPTVCLSESCAQQLVDSINTRYRDGSMPYGKRHQMTSNRGHDSLGSEYMLRGVLHATIASMEKFNWHNFQNPLLKRQFEVLLRELKYPVLNDNLWTARHHLTSLGNEQFVCERNQKYGECRKSFNKLTKPDMVKSHNLDLILWNWAEWRNKLPADIKGYLNFYIHSYQNMSTPEMPASAIWYQQYEDGNFIDELEKVMQTIGPFYSQMHGHLRHALRLQYGNNIIPASGLIPHHLMEQAFYQSWKKNSLLRNPYPNKKMPNMQHDLDGLGIDSFEFVNASVQFFGSMGFDLFTNEFMESRFIENQYGGPDCKAIITTYPDIEMLYCPRSSYKKLLTAHGDMAHIEYAVLRNDKPVGLNQEACPGFGNAMAEAVILSASTPKHLQQRLGLLLDYEYDNELNLNFLYRMAVHALFSIPNYFVHEKLWLEIIDKKITPEEYNCRYWDLMAKYMGVGRPAVETQRGAYEMPYKFYEGVVEDVKSTKKLFGEFLGYQIYHDICLAIGEYQPGNPDKILQKCDFANNKHAGDLLKSMMSAGSTKPWREVIAALTPSHVNKLQGAAFLAYYEPLNTWITQSNAANNIQVGWTPVNTCQRSH